MKYIKLFEDDKNLKFQIDDLVKVKKGKSYPEWQNKIFKTISLENPDIGGGLWGMINLENEPLWGGVIYFYGKELTKPTKKDLENLKLRQDTNKYNL